MTLREHDLIRTCTAWLQQPHRVLVAHYYTPAIIQDIAMSTGGIVADSMEMARFASQHAASEVVVAGVRFMGETVKILSPSKRVLVPDLAASCSLDEGCSVDAFRALRSQHADRVAVVYANTSAAVKAEADWVVTSSTALTVVKHLVEQGQRILWAPDVHLGQYVQKATGADMVMVEATCIVHEEFQSAELAQLRGSHQDAIILAHPEAPDSVLAMADVIGSTSVIISHILQSNHACYIVATDAGILHYISIHAPHKHVLVAPTSTVTSECQRCARCPYMAMNTLEALERSCSVYAAEVVVDEAVRQRAVRPIQRTMDFMGL